MKEEVNKNSEKLVKEVLQGQHPMDKLPEEGIDFSGAVQAYHFARLRDSLTTEPARIIMEENQQLGELGIYRKIKSRQHKN